MSQIVRPTLPLDEGDRVVGIRLVDEARSSDHFRAFHDLLLRGDGMQSVGLMASSILTGSISARQIGLIALYAVSMLMVCALACVVQTRRALRVEPSESMRAPV